MGAKGGSQGTSVPILPGNGSGEGQCQMGEKGPCLSWVSIDESNAALTSDD